jgi:hypothetical protein
MDYLYLPYLTPEESLNTAFDRMFVTDSRAIILDRINIFELYTNEHVADALTESYKTTCADLSSEIAIRVANLMGQLSKLLYPIPQFTPFSVQDILENIFEQQFAAHTMDYGVLVPPFPARPGNMILVVTRYEERKNDILDRKKVCVCSGPRGHKAYGKNTGDPCDVDPPETYKCT